MKVYTVWMYGNLESIHATRNEAVAAGKRAAKADFDHPDWTLEEFTEEVIEIREAVLGKRFK